ncbi:hypothetical protein [Bacteroides faecis]|nr:hypothetical protein [Bacteroides faecis]MCS2482200.1 hypothetical protein [Bacteroides faecis]
MSSVRINKTLGGGTSPAVFDWHPMARGRERQRQISGYKRVSDS